MTKTARIVAYCKIMGRSVDSTDVAKEVGCHPAYVRKVWARFGFQKRRKPYVGKLKLDGKDNCAVP